MLGHTCFYYRKVSQLTACQLKLCVEAAYSKASGHWLEIIVKAWDLSKCKCLAVWSIAQSF